MKKTWFLLFAALVISSLVLAACGGGGAANNGGEAGGGAQGEALDRPEPPAEYASMTNPHEGDDAAAQAGQQIYQTNCASCHGESGLGDGPAAAALDPAPQDLRDNEEGLSDAYLHWRIAEGGQMAPFNSAMPAWKNTLSEDQIWQVVTYLRTLD
jgi:cytochrome c553